MSTDTCKIKLIQNCNTFDLFSFLSFIQVSVSPVPDDTVSSSKRAVSGALQYLS